MDKLFVIGNGKSRLNFEVNKLKDLGHIIVCNFAFMDIKCDAVAAVDRKPVDLIRDSNVPLIFVDYRTQVDPERKIFWNGELIGNMPNHLIDCDEKHWENWDSGRLALIAGLIKYKPKQVFLLGFDFLDLPDPKKHWQKQDSNNIYHDRHIERPPNTERIYNWCVDQYPETLFYRVGPYDPILNKLKMNCISYDDFKEYL